METPKHVSDELRKEVIKKFNLDPLNNNGLIEVISFLYERNTKLEEMIMEIAKKIKCEYYDISGKLIGEQSLFDNWNK